MKLPKPPYSYRTDMAVPSFPDAQPVIIFDGQCVLCSRFMRFIIRNDHDARFRFIIAQSSLGVALNRHYGLDPARRETYLVLIAGEAYGKATAFSKIMSTLGWPWRLLAAVQWLPAMIADWCYDRVRDNKYRLMGQAPVCQLPTEGFHNRLIDARPDSGPDVAAQ